MKLRKKKSMVKQMGELLDTDDKREQLQRVEYLKQQAAAPMVAITIVLKGAMVDFVVLGRPAPEVLLQALDAVRDDIIKAMARAEVEQQPEVAAVGPPTGDTMANGDMTP